MHQVKVTAEQTGWLVSCLEPKTRYPDRRYLPDIRTIPGKQDIRCKSGFSPEIRRLSAAVRILAFPPSARLVCADQW